jgi:hypothetical protein
VNVHEWYEAEGWFKLLRCMRYVSVQLRCRILVCRRVTGYARRFSSYSGGVLAAGKKYEPLPLPEITNQTERP